MPVNSSLRFIGFLSIFFHEFVFCKVLLDPHSTVRFMFKIQTRHIKLNEAIWTNFRYADVMCSVLNNQFGYLIASIEREVDSPGCMPHSLSFDDVKDLFGKLLHFSRGPFINDVSSEGEGGGHKIRKMSRRRL